MSIEGPRRATIDDVARLANVHKATVSRALNSATRHQVSAATVERIEQAAAELGYVANAMARGLRTSSSMTIGVVIPDLTNPFFPPIVRGIENFLQPRGYTVLLANTDSSEEIERAALESLLGRRVDGLIVASGDQEHQNALAEAYAAGVKAVMVNRDGGAVPYPLVTGNDASGVAAAVAHLVELGHRELLHIAGPPELSTSAVRAGAFLEACRASKVPAAQVIETRALTVEAGQNAMDRILRAGPRPTAVVAGNDLIALGVLRSLRVHGLSCPGDVSVVGFNDITFAEDF
ncbi:MAG: LacI family DNA-binding transcriptional regulator, partial [Microbacteriaceae bacterium]|nr:LacI family DNA-binding transcriptional regulator [Microbacteriaceae bacterium]